MVPSTLGHTHISTAYLLLKQGPQKTHQRLRSLALSPAELPYTQDCSSFQSSLTFLGSIQGNTDMTQPWSDFFLQNDVPLWRATAAFWLVFAKVYPLFQSQAKSFSLYLKHT